MSAERLRLEEELPPLEKPCPCCDGKGGGDAPFHPWTTCGHCGGSGTVLTRAGHQVWTLVMNRKGVLKEVLGDD